jgi:hypothetical protein
MVKRSETPKSALANDGLNANTQAQVKTKRLPNFEKIAHQLF